MRSEYEIVYKRPDKSESIVATVKERHQASLYVETPQFMGTWINEDRKILRYGRGEVYLRRVFIRPSIKDRSYTNAGEPQALLSIKYGEELHWIVITKDYIAGYDLKRTKELWRVTNIARLPIYTDKELAYHCMVEYDTLIDTYKLQGAL